MNDGAIEELARRAGIAVEWTDYAGARRRVAPDSSRRLLEALGLPCANESDLAESRRRLDEADRNASALTCVAGEIFEPPSLIAPRGGRIEFEGGGGVDLAPALGGPRGMVIDRIGRHRILHDFGETVLVAAPARCFSIADVAPGEKLWGLVAQIYSLRHTHDGGFGDMAAVAQLVEAAALRGADALALSPNHALFSADPHAFSPYAPSSRLFLNPLYSNPALIFPSWRADSDHRNENRTATLDDLINWPQRAESKLEKLRRLFSAFQAGRAADAIAWADFEAFRKQSGDLLESHALFEALHADRLGASATGDWRQWPAEWRSPESAAVGAFAAAHEKEIAFHAFLQWLADRSMAAAQEKARGAGMRIGLIADLAVGMTPGGSHAWSRQTDILVGVAVGAPPDLYNQAGQDWGLTTFSPRALSEKAFEPFAATMRATMRHAGGVRIDHVMGLSRLWLIPERAEPADGAYLAFPFDDLARIVALESTRNRAIIIAEDLGTVPEGFRARLAALAILGMNVLWFERRGARFTPPREWSADAVAMTSTHDLPTLAGWWRGHDIVTREALHLDEPARIPLMKAARETERAALWDAIHDAAPSRDGPPAANDETPFVDAALVAVAPSPSPLALFPLEDALGLVDQPNLPGTIDEHPNWRRRYADDAATMLDPPGVKRRLRRIDAARRAP